MAKLTVADVEQRVQHIRDISGDSEGAHVEADKLYEEVLRAIADGQRGAKDLAAAALKVEDIDFDWRCA